MYFNEEKYKKCIHHLIAIKICIIISFIIIFMCAGAGAGYPIMKSMNGDWRPITVAIAIGFVIGFIMGLFSTWEIEMKIQEAYWNIDVIRELKKRNELASKNAPIAKTVVAIENKQLSSDKKENE